MIREKQAMTLRSAKRRRRHNNHMPAKRLSKAERARAKRMAALRHLFASYGERQNRAPVTLPKLKFLET